MNETAKRIARSIILANFHKGGLKICRLYDLAPDFFDALKKECLWIHEHLPASDVTRKDHVTNWTNPDGKVLQYSLYNHSGKTDDTNSDFASPGPGKSFHLITPYNAIESLIEKIQDSGLINMRLNYIGPGSKLAPHEEHNVHRRGDGIYVRVRFHLPIVTNEACQVLLDGEFFFMQAGAVYFFNNGCVHASKNEGSTGRLHLVFDMEFTQDCFEDLFCAGLCDEERFLIPWRSEVTSIGDCAVKNFESYPDDIAFSEAIEKVAFA